MPSITSISSQAEHLKPLPAAYPRHPPRMTAKSTKPFSAKLETDDHLNTDNASSRIDAVPPAPHEHHRQRKLFGSKSSKRRRTRHAKLGGGSSNKDQPIKWQVNALAGERGGSACIGAGRQDRKSSSTLSPSDTLYIGNINVHAVDRQRLLEHVQMIISTADANGNDTIEDGDDRGEGDRAPDPQEQSSQFEDIDEQEGGCNKGGVPFEPEVLKPVAASREAAPHLLALRLVANKRTGKYQGFALLKCSSCEETLRLAGLLDKSILEGQQLDVQVHRSGSLSDVQQDELIGQQQDTASQEGQGSGKESTTGGHEGGEEPSPGHLKRVKFAPNDHLCDIKYFECDPRERRNKALRRTCAIQ